MDIQNVKSIIVDLKDYIPTFPDGQYMSVTQWNNGEGWTIDNNGKVFNLHYQELDLINYLTKFLDYSK